MKKYGLAGFLLALSILLCSCQNHTAIVDITDKNSSEAHQENFAITLGEYKNWFYSEAFLDFEEVIENTEIPDTLIPLKDAGVFLKLLQSSDAKSVTAACYQLEHGVDTVLPVERNADGTYTVTQKDGSVQIAKFEKEVFAFSITTNDDKGNPVRIYEILKTEDGAVAIQISNAISDGFTVIQFKRLGEKGFCAYKSEKQVNTLLRGRIPADFAKN